MPNHPIAVELKAGQRFSWCRCGKSKTDPICDGSHKGTGITPLRITPEADKTVYVCGCKKTGNPPFCDGSHQIYFGGSRDDYYQDSE